MLNQDKLVLLKHPILYYPAIEMLVNFDTHMELLCMGY